MKNLDPRIHIFYLLHYPLVRFRALLIHDFADETFIFSDKDYPGHFENLTKPEALRYLSDKPETLDLTNNHHREMIESFGITLKSLEREVK